MATTGACRAGLHTIRVFSQLYPLTRPKVSFSFFLSTWSSSGIRRRSNNQAKKKWKNNVSFSHHVSSWRKEKQQKNDVPEIEKTRKKKSLKNSFRHVFFCCCCCCWAKIWIGNEMEKRKKKLRLPPRKKSSRVEVFLFVSMISRGGI